MYIYIYIYVCIYIYIDVYNISPIFSDGPRGQGAEGRRVEAKVHGRAGACDSQSNTLNRIGYAYIMYRYMYRYMYMYMYVRTYIYIYIYIMHV